MTPEVEIAFIVAGFGVIPALLNYRLAARAAKEASLARQESTRSAEAALHAGEVAHKVDAKLDAVGTKLDGKLQEMLEMRGDASFAEGILEQKRRASEK